jgi:CheY-like chemotaxis protein
MSHVKQDFLSSQEKIQQHQRTILQVDDDAANLLLVVELLSRHSDLKVLTASNGHDALNMAYQHQPCVILMDINMHSLNGFEALAILRANPETVHIPVIALSSDAYPSQIKAGLEAGFYRYLTKPFILAELMDAIEAALLYRVET